MADRLGDAPIELQYRDAMNRLARAVDSFLNGEEKPARNGFILMVFPLENHEGRCNYISNTRREDIVVLLREQLRRFEGAPDATGRA